MKRLNVLLTEDEHAEFKQLAAKKRTTMTDLVEAWIREALTADKTSEAGSKGGVCYPLKRSRTAMASMLADGG